MIPAAELTTFVLGMVAASAAAAIGSYASDLLQGRRQRSEWARQEERARQDRVELAERERKREEEAKDGTIRGVALEALWNALGLITFAARVKTWKDARLSPFSLSRRSIGACRCSPATRKDYRWSPRHM
jgi:hypothetical protein